MADLDYIINFASNTLGIDSANSAIGKLGVALGALGVGVAAYKIVGFLSDATKGAADFEQQLATVQAVSGATTEQMNRIKEASVELGKSTRYNATEAAAGFEILARAGLNVENSLKTMPSVLALAQGNALELGEAAGFVTKTVQGMGLSFDDSARVADVLAKASASANTDVRGLGSAMSYAAPTAASLGISVEETAAYIGQFANAGIDASRAGTSFNGMLSQFGNSASSFKRELANIGITTNDFNEAIRQLSASGDRGQKAINALGLEAGPALKALLAQGMGSLDDLTGKLNNAGGAAAEQAEIMNSTWQGAFAGLDSVWQSVKDTLGEPILEPLSQAFKDVGGVIGELIDSGKIEQLGKSIGAVFTEATVYVVDFIRNIDMAAVIDKVSGSLDSLRGIATAANGAFQALNIAFQGLKGGVLAIGVAVSMVITIFAELWKMMIDGGSAIAKFFGISTGAADKLSAGLGRAMQASEDFRNYATDELAEASKSMGASMRSIAGESENTEKTVSAAGSGMAETFKGIVKAAKEGAEGTEESTAEIRKNVSEMIDGFGAPEQFAELLGLITETGQEATVGSALINRLIAGTGDLGGKAKESVEKAKVSIKEMGTEAEQQAEKVRTAIESTFSALNIDVQQNLNGVNTKTQQTFDLIANGAKSVSESTYSATEKARLLSALFAEGLNAAKTKEEFVALNEVTKHYGLSSVITAEQHKKLQEGMKGGEQAAKAAAEALDKHTIALDDNTSKASVNTGAVRENTTAREQQSTSIWNAKFANDENTKSESASLAMMQRATAGIKDKIAALNQLNGTADTADESYKKLMKSMGFVDGYKWSSMEAYARDMERVTAAVDRQAESFSAKNTKHRRSDSSGSTSTAGSATPEQIQDNRDAVAADLARKKSEESATSAPVKTININLQSSSGTVNATIPESQEAMFEAFLKQLSDSRSVAGY